MQERFETIEQSIRELERVLVNYVGVERLGTEVDDRTVPRVAGVNSDDSWWCGTWRKYQRLLRLVPRSAGLYTLPLPINDHSSAAELGGIVQRDD